MESREGLGASAELAGRKEREALKARAGNSGGAAE